MIQPALTDADLRDCNTLHLPARAARLQPVDDDGDLPALTDDQQRRGEPLLVLGGGSNIVFGADFPGTVLHMRTRGIEVLDRSGDSVTVAVAAGEPWHDWVACALAHGWHGLENLALIPGTVGAAPVQNIGAYGLELADRFLSLETFDLTSGRQQRLARADCRFGYRDSVFKQQGWHVDGRRLITRVNLRLPKVWQPLTGYADLAAELERRQIAAPTPRQVADAVIAVRRRKLPDPAQLPNAGSFFHNPLLSAADAERLLGAYPQLPRYPQPDGRIKVAAGWLIEHSGWKGRDLGRAGMYEKQALVLVNRGGARGADVLALARAVQTAVRERFGIELAPEPVLL